MESKAIADAQISASSQMNGSHSAPQARLHFKAGWSALKSDLHQWLQVDLGSYTTVTRVATQGVKDGNKQWVTKYRLQYSDDGMTFQYYKERGDTSAKVHRPLRLT